MSTEFAIFLIVLCALIFLAWSNHCLSVRVNRLEGDMLRTIEDWVEDQAKKEKFK
jgi:hypothetical protein